MTVEHQVGLRRRRRPSKRQLSALLLGAALLVPVAPQLGSATSTRGPRASAGTDRVARKLARVAAVRSASAAQKKRWLSGPLSHTYELDPFGVRQVSTMEVVAYKGKRNATFPRVGNIYLVSIWVGRSGDNGAGNAVVTEVKLPRRTKLAIKHSVKRRRVRCYKGKLNGSYRQLKGTACPNRPVRGFHGWRFVPKRGPWAVPRTEWIEVIFPVRSGTRLRGLADHRNACVVGSVQNLSGWAIDDWDAPRRGQTCPFPDGQGAYQGVFVARRRR